MNKFTILTAVALSLTLLLAACAPAATIEPTVADSDLIASPTTQPMEQPDPSGDPLYTQPSQGVVLTPLSDAWKQQVEDDWTAATGTNLGNWSNVVENTDGIRYYGNYNGYDILFRPTDDDAVTNLEVEDVTFSHNTTFEIYAYQDGDFTPIKELSDQGKLTAGNLVELLAVHRSYGRTSIGPQGPVLTAETLELMKLAFLNQFVSSDEYTTKDLSVVYFGQYGDAHVGFINGILMYTQALCSETVGGVTFHYNTGQKLLVFYEGQLIGLRAAYEQGALTQDDLLAIRNAHNPQPDNFVTE